MTQPTDRPWLHPTRPPRERAELLVAAMTLHQKIAQLHGAMATIDIYAIPVGELDAEEMEQLAAQIRIERHWTATTTSASRGCGSPTARWASAWATGRLLRRPPRCR